MMMTKRYPRFEIKTNSELIYELIRINPGVIFRHDDTFGYAEISCKPEHLRLPNQYFYCANNNIMGKRKMKNGKFIKLTLFYNNDKVKN